MPLETFCGLRNRRHHYHQWDHYWCRSLALRLLHRWQTAQQHSLPCGEQFPPSMICDGRIPLSSLRVFSGLPHCCVQPGQHAGPQPPPGSPHDSAPQSTTRNFRGRRWWQTWAASCCDSISSRLRKRSSSSFSHARGEASCCDGRARFLRAVGQSLQRRVRFIYQNARGFHRGARGYWCCWLHKSKRTHPSRISMSLVVGHGFVSCPLVCGSKVAGDLSGSSKTNDVSSCCIFQAERARYPGAITQHILVSAPTAVPQQ